ncbi:MAG: CoA-binding protein [Pseudomonadota bacterium]|nr:CoA-binding protein [Pseudomonadota bacterium]
MQKNPLKTIMNPKSIAYLGGSNSLQTMGTAQLITLISGGYRGKIYPVHRKEKTVLGLQAYPNISSIGKPVDLAVIVIPGSSIADEADHCGLDVPLFSPALQEKIKDKNRRESSEVETDEHNQ